MQLQTQRQLQERGVQHMHLQERRWRPKGRRLQPSQQERQTSRPLLCRQQVCLQHRPLLPPPGQRQGSSRLLSRFLRRQPQLALTSSLTKTVPQLQQRQRISSRRQPPRQWQPLLWDNSRQRSMQSTRGSEHP